jgi:choice-of-anchor A domain-containing protein
MAGFVRGCFFACLGILGLLVLPLQTAGATTLSATDILRSFNAVVAGDFSLRSDVSGPVVVGGNLTGGQGDFYGQHLPTSGSAFGGYSTLAVYGDIRNASYNVNGGTVNVVGSAVGRVSVGNNVNYGAAMPYSFDNIWSTLTAASLGLSQLAPAAQAPLPAAGTNGATLNAVIGSVPGQTNVAVINITTAQLASYPDLKVNLNGATTVIINVTGTSFSGHPNIHNNQSSFMSNVIWNFVDATTIDFGSTGWAGTVLATKAAVTTSNPIDGTVIAGSFNGASELHWTPTQADLSFLTPAPPPSTISASNPPAVPEPGTAAILGVSLVGLLALRWRRPRGR